MKRILPSLIILVILIANLFAPFEYSLKEKSFRSTQVEAQENIISGKDITLCSTKTVRDADFCIYTTGGKILTDTKNPGKMIVSLAISMESNLDTPETMAITTILRESGQTTPIKIWTNYRYSDVSGGYSSLYNKMAVQPKNGLSVRYEQHDKPNESTKDWAVLSGLIGSDNLKPDTSYVFEFSVAPLDDDGLAKAISTFARKADSDPAFQTFPVGYTDDTGKLLSSDVVHSFSLDVSTGALGTKADIDKDVIGAGGEVPTMPECGLTELGGCFAQLVYYVAYVPTSWAMMAAGLFMDFSLNYSLDSASYSGESTGFVTKAWGFMRDLCNIFFIVSMLYIALSVIFEFKGASDWKKAIGSLVIAALAINFSLFITKIPIDLGNITARVFYNSDLIKVTKVSDNGETTGTLSEAVVEGFNPQFILYQGLSKINNVKGDSGSGTVTPSSFLIVTIFAVIINWIALWIFFKIGLLFLGRVVSLWYHMILSPWAFISDWIPSAIKIGNFSFGSWMKEIIKLSVMPVIFMALMYLLLLFISLGAPAISKDGNAFAWIIGTVAPFVFIIIMLKKAQTITEGYADSMAKTVADYAGKAVGTVAGLAAGGAGILGTATLGRFAGNLAGSGFAGKLAENQAKGGLKGLASKYALKTIDVAQKGTYDARNTLAANKFASSGFGALKDKNLDRVSQALKIDDKQGSYSDRKKMSAMATNEKIDSTKKRIDDLSANAVKKMTTLKRDPATGKLINDQTWDQFILAKKNDYTSKLIATGVSAADAEAEFNLIDEGNFINEFKGKLKGSQEKRWQDNLKGNKFMSTSGGIITGSSAVGAGIATGALGGGVVGVVTGAQQYINRQGEGVVLSGMEKVEKLESSKKSIKDKLEQMEEDYKDLSTTHPEVVSVFTAQTPGAANNLTADQIMINIKKSKRNAINLRKKQVEAIDKAIESTKKAYTKGEDKK